jgi:hypothetical protein
MINTTVCSKMTVLIKLLSYYESSTRNLSNTLETEFLQNNLLEFSSYLTGNTLCLG